MGSYGGLPRGLCSRLVACLAFLIALQARAQPCSDDAAVEVLNGLSEWMMSGDFETFKYQEGASLLIAGGFDKYCQALHNFLRKPSRFEKHAAFLSKQLEQQLANGKELPPAVQAMVLYNVQGPNQPPSRGKDANRLGRLLFKLGTQVQGLVAEHIVGLARWCERDSSCRRAVWGAVVPTAKYLAVQLRARAVHVSAVALTVVPSFLKVGYWVREWLHGRVEAAKAMIETGVAAAEMMGTLGGGAVVAGAAILAGLSQLAVATSTLVGGAVGAWAAESWAPWLRKLLSELFDQHPDDTLAASYKFLNVPTSSSNFRVNRAYREKSLLFHPDKPGGSKVKFFRLGYCMELIRAEREL